MPHSTIDWWCVGHKNQDTPAEPHTDDEKQSSSSKKRQRRWVTHWHQYVPDTSPNTAFLPSPQHGIDSIVCPFTRQRTHFTILLFTQTISIDGGKRGNGRSRSRNRNTATQNTTASLGVEQGTTVFEYTRYTNNTGSNCGKPGAPKRVGVVAWRKQYVVDASGGITA